MPVTKRIPASGIDSCPATHSGAVFGKKWTIAIIQEIFFEKQTGFNQLKKALKKISPRILSYRLKELEKNKIISKKIKQKNNSKQSIYSLTKKGKELQTIIDELKTFGIKWENTGTKCLNTKCTECEQFKN